MSPDTVFAMAVAVLGEQRAEQIAPSLEERAGHVAEVARRAPAAEVGPATEFTSLLEHLAGGRR